MQITISVYKIHPHKHCITKKPQKHKKMSTRHFTMGMICTTQLRSSIILKNEKQTWEHVYQTSYYQYQQNSFNKLNKINSAHIRASHFSNLNNNLTTKKTQAINMKYFEKNRKLIPFLEVWSRDDEEKWWIFERNTMSLWERWTEKTMNSHNE